MTVEAEALWLKILLQVFREDAAIAGAQVQP